MKKSKANKFTHVQLTRNYNNLKFKERPSRMLINFILPFTILALRIFDLHDEMMLTEELVRKIMATTNKNIFCIVI